MTGIVFFQVLYDALFFNFHIFLDQTQFASISLQTTAPMMKRNFSLSVLVCILHFSHESRHRPDSPCPDLFNYFVSQTDEVFGALRFKNDNSGEYNLTVRMSIPLTTKKVTCLLLLLVSGMKKMMTQVFFSSDYYYNKANE